MGHGLYYFSKNDRIIVVIGAVTVFVVLALGYFTKKYVGEMTFDGDRTERGAKTDADGKPLTEEGKPAETFPFDPNTADSTTLMRLGLQRWIVRNICKYRKAGGVYRTKEDFARVYGLTVGQYERLAPYIRIGREFRPAAEVYGNAPYPTATGNRYADAEPRDTVARPYKLRPGQTIALNSADTTQLKKVPGIGSGWALAVVRQRQRLGGFYSTEQLRQIEGFPEEALPYLTVSSASISKMRINELTFSQLRQHPYINYYQARDITDYRRLRGKIGGLQELRMMKSFTDSDIERLSHYIEF